MDKAPEAVKICLCCGMLLYDHNCACPETEELLTQMLCELCGKCPYHCKGHSKVLDLSHIH